MPVNKEAYLQIKAECDAAGVTLVAVSKIKPNEDIMTLYQLGHRDFGENYVQELLAKYEALPKDIRWHFIGHLQSNKVKYISRFIHLIHGVDSEKLLLAIDKEGQKNAKVIDCLLQVHIASEETKFGFDEAQLASMSVSHFANARICGLMGMASFSNDENLVRSEFKKLKALFNQLEQRITAAAQWSTILSMGMSGDYKIAIEEGSNMVRIGSLLFGMRG
ncbi:MAG: YggS family pyridoxal phosphate-dependent enzyme [Chitinophagaceae bacterium]